MKKWPTPNRMTLRTKGAEKNANNLGTFLQNIPIAQKIVTCSMRTDRQTEVLNTEDPIMASAFQAYGHYMSGFNSIQRPTTYYVYV